MKLPINPGLLFTLALVAVPATANDWSLDWWTIDGGGTILASGGDWELSGTIGQWDSSELNELSGGGWMITGGFWSATATSTATDEIFSDRYEE